MQQLREELAVYEDEVQRLIEAAQDNRKDFVQEILNDGKVDVNQGRTRSP